LLQGDAELDAEGVRLEGDVRYVVPAGWRLSLRPDGPSGGGVEESWTHLPTWAAAAGAAAGAGPAVGAGAGYAAAGGATAVPAGPTWRWKYAMGEASRVKLQLEEREQSLPSHGKSHAEAMAALGHKIVHPTHCGGGAAKRGAAGKENSAAAAAAKEHSKHANAREELHSVVVQRSVATKERAKEAGVGRVVKNGGGFSKNGSSRTSR
jgi:hypothetical protein